MPAYQRASRQDAVVIFYCKTVECIFFNTIKVNIETKTINASDKCDIINVVNLEYIHFPRPGNFFLEFPFKSGT